MSVMGVHQAGGMFGVGEGLNLVSGRRDGRRRRSEGGGGESKEEEKKRRGDSKL